MTTHIHNNYQLTLSDFTAPLDILAFDGEEALSQPYRYRIEFTSPERDIPATNVLRKKACFACFGPAPVASPYSREAPEHLPLRALHGVVTGFRQLWRAADQVGYEVVLEPALALLARGQQHRVYVGQSVPEIVEQVLRKYHGWQGFAFRFQLAREYGRRRQVIQFGESDLAFIQRLLAEEGIWYRFAEGEHRWCEVLHLHDDTHHYVPHAPLPYCEQPGLTSNGADAVWALQAAHQVVEQDVYAQHYCYQNPISQCPPATASIDHSNGAEGTYGRDYVLYDQFAERGPAHLTGPQLPSPGGYFSARLAHERHLNRRTRLSATTSSPSLAPGHLLQVTGNPLASACPEGIAITHLRVSGSRQQSFTAHLEGIPNLYRAMFRPPRLPKPVMAGTVPARIVGHHTTGYADIDPAGEYLVRFLFDLEEREPNRESKLLRLARAYAGSSYGLHFPLLEGTEVAIAFEHGDPDRPYIAHALHDAAHTDHVAIGNRSRNVLRTPANNKLRLEDRRGEEHIKLSCEYGGKSQLNLGHIVDAKATPRGEGFELRSDHWGVLRAGRGLLISADEQAKGVGPVRDTGAASALVQGALAHYRHCQRIASDHHSLPPATEGLQQLAEHTEQLRGRSLLLSAPDALAAVTGNSALLKAGHSLYQHAGHDLHLAAGQRLALQAEQQLSLLSREAGVRIVSGNGPLDLASHAGPLGLVAQAGVSVESTQGEVLIKAPKGITLACGGGLLRIAENGDIQLHTPGVLSLKGQHQWCGAQGEALGGRELPAAVCEECLLKAAKAAAGAVMRGLSPAAEGAAHG